MIFLHLGWPKTGTTTLQAGLAGHGRALAAAGIVYPDRWRHPEGDGHNGLADLVRASCDSPAALDDFKAFLAAQRDRHVILSAEALSHWLLRDRGRETLTALLAAAAEAAPVRCVWTLRRVDAFALSQYLHLVRVGIASKTADAFMEDMPVNELFIGLRAIEDCLPAGATYVRYDPSGRHNAELLRALGASDELADDLASAIGRGPRLNASLSHKQLVAVASAEALSARAGVELGRDELSALFRRGDFKFDDDGPCAPVDDATRAKLHGRALESARRAGVTAYVRFFADDAPATQGIAPRSLDLDMLTDADMSRLLEHMRRVGRAASVTSSS